MDLKSTLAIAAAFAMAAPVAHSATIATWSDPGTTSFDFTDTGTNNDGIGELTAFNNDISVVLVELGLTFDDASYTLTDNSGGSLTTTSQTGTGGGPIVAEFEAGKLEIFTDSPQHGLGMGDLVLLITFDAATGFFGSLTADDSIVGHNVTFSGPAVDGLTLTNESFQFSSTNILPGSALLGAPDMEDWTSTTAFTSSATPVPVPAAVWLFGSGLIGLLGIGRRKKA